MTVFCLAASGPPTNAIAQCRRPPAPATTARSSARPVDRQHILAAARAGDAVAMLILSQDYRYGSGVPRDPEQAMHWALLAAEHGSTIAMSAVARAYRTGDGAPKDIARAVYWDRRRADLGDPVAMSALVRAYRRGEGVPKDSSEADRWLARYRSVWPDGPDPEASPEAQRQQLEKIAAAAARDAQEAAGDAEDDAAAESGKGALAVCGLSELQRAIETHRDAGLLVCNGELCRNMDYVKTHILGLAAQGVLEVGSPEISGTGSQRILRLSARIDDHPGGGIWELAFTFLWPPNDDLTLQKAQAQFTWSVVN